MTTAIEAATVAQEYLLVIGPPGTAKSAVVHAALQPLPRSARLVKSMRVCFAAEPADPAALETAIRETLWFFSTNVLPAELAPLRAQLVDRGVAA